jgi:hypothetical protein
VADAGTALPAVVTLPSDWAVLVGDVGVIGVDASALAACDVLPRKGHQPNRDGSSPRVVLQNPAKSTTLTSAADVWRIAHRASGKVGSENQTYGRTFPKTPGGAQIGFLRTGLISKLPTCRRSAGKPAASNSVVGRLIDAGTLVVVTDGLA